MSARKGGRTRAYPVVCSPPSPIRAPYSHRKGGHVAPAPPLLATAPSTHGKEAHEGTQLLACPPPPLAAAPCTRGKGACEGTPAPPFPIRAKGGSTRACCPPSPPVPPLPSRPRRPVRAERGTRERTALGPFLPHSRGRGAHEGTPPGNPPWPPLDTRRKGAWERSAPLHPFARMGGLRGNPLFSPLAPIFAQKGHPGAQVRRANGRGVEWNGGAHKRTVNYTHYFLL
ncbi:hypothetical protein EDB85DRAFT_2201915 [Lactarius pseudohatsudake]|nr:hypothetical protein EDB85DRAFT_2201915 [Lactarius pseudohatsudake]